MNYLAVNELKSPRKLWGRLDAEHELLLTNNGHPMAVIMKIEQDENPEDLLRYARIARGECALRKIRHASLVSGKSKMTLGEINRIIDMSRKERGHKQ